MAPFDIFIGQPESGHHPLHFQADWLLKQRGGTILPEVMDAIAKLNELATQNGVPLEDLCVYALGSAQDENDSSNSEKSLAQEEAGQTEIAQSLNPEEVYNEEESETVEANTENESNPDSQDNANQENKNK